MAELEDFERVFGPLRILNNKEDLFMEVMKKIKFVGTKVGDQGSTMWYVKATDEEFYSTWDLQVGKRIEELDFKEGDIVKIQYATNKKGYKNITAIEKEIQVDKEVEGHAETYPTKIPPQMTKSPMQYTTAKDPTWEAREGEKTRDIHRQVAWKIAGSAWGWYDLTGLKNEDRQQFLIELAKTIEGILNG